MRSSIAKPPLMHTAPLFFIPLLFYTLGIEPFYEIHHKSHTNRFAYIVFCVRCFIFWITPYYSCTNGNGIASACTSTNITSSAGNKY